MFSFGKKEKVILVLDIGSGSVGGMLFRQKEGQKPEIISSKRIDIKTEQSLSGIRFYRLQKNALEKVLKNLKNNFSRRVDLVFCILTSVFYISQTRIIKVKRPKSFEITKKLIDDLVSDEVKIFEKTEGDKEDSVFFETEIMRTVLNGYDTREPLGKKARTLEIYVYMSIGKREIKEKIEEEVSKQFPSSKFIFNSFPFTAFSVLKDLLNAEEGFLLVDVGGELTDISLIKKRVLEETISFPLGKNFLIRKIADILNSSIIDSSATLERFSRRHGSAKVTEKISVVFSEVRNEWERFFEKSLEELKDHGFIPQSVFVLGNEWITEQFPKFLEDERFTEITSLKKPFEVRKILPDAIKEHFKSDDLPSAHTGGDGRGRRDIFLMIEALFADRLL